MIGDHLTKIENIFLKRIIKKVVKQGGHEERITALYREINEEGRKVFTEDTRPSFDDFLRDCHEESLKDLHRITMDEVWKRIEEKAKAGKPDPELQKLAATTMKKCYEEFDEKERSLAMTEKDRNRRYDL